MAMAQNALLLLLLLLPSCGYPNSGLSFQTIWVFRLRVHAGDMWKCTGVTRISFLGSHLMQEFCWVLCVMVSGFRFSRELAESGSVSLAFWGHWPGRQEIAWGVGFRAFGLRDLGLSV